MFKTKDGQKTGAELAKQLASGQPQKFDAESVDGKLTLKVRGAKSIAQGEIEEVKNLAELQKHADRGKTEEPGDKTGEGEGGIAAKLFDQEVTLGNLGVTSLPTELITMMPLLRTMTTIQRVETLQAWFNTPPSARSRLSREFKLLRAMSHLDAIKATGQFEQVSDAEQTLSRSGDRVDFVTGHNPLAKLSPIRTALRATAAGGILDNKSEVREVRVENDAPHLLFVVDTSGSTNFHNRLASIAAAIQAVANYYAGRGATFGFVVFQTNSAVVVHPPEPNVDVILDAIASLAPNWGTSYASGLELAYRVALPNTTVILAGDFEDNGVPSASALGMKAQKEIKTIGVVSSAGHPDYAAVLCDEVTVVNFENGLDVALNVLQFVTSVNP